MLEDDFPFGRAYFQVQTVSFGEGIYPYRNPNPNHAVSKKCASGSGLEVPSNWNICNDLSRGHLKWWFSKGIPPKSP